MKNDLSFNYLKLLPNEIFIKIFIFLDIINYDNYKYICPDYINFKIYLNNLIYNNIDLKKHQSEDLKEITYSMNIQFNKNYKFSTSNITLKNIRKIILKILDNKKYKNYLNLWINDKIKFN